MKRVLILALFGCGFDHGRLPMQPPIDGREVTEDADRAIDAPVDAPVMIDAAWTTAMCPTGYTTYPSTTTTSSKYRLNTMGKSFWAHYDDCKDDLPGKTHLVAVDSVSEAMSIIGVINSTNNLPMVSGFVLPYAGGLQQQNFAATNTGWISITGGTLFAGAWNNSEPNDGGDNVEDDEENHYAFFRGQTYMADLHGSFSMAGVCECDGLAISSTFAMEVEATRP